MAIQSVNPLAASAPTPSAQQKSSAPDLTNGAAPNQQMFLQLLVAQLKNQDPLNPTDGTQFVAQLAQFSELEQTISIKQNTDTIVSGLGSLAYGGGASVYPNTTPASQQVNQ
jgi:flagellar basal-body rod modification protein FlgD